jgi:hypothetical protein
MLPKCDIIIPVARIDRFVEKSIKSAHESIGIDSRVILVNNSKEKPNKFTCMLRTQDIYLEEPQKGYAHALNSPLKQGVEFYDFVSFLNSDDIVSEDKFRKQVEVIYESKSDLAITQLRKFSGKVTIPKRYGNYNYKYWNKVALLLGAYGADASQLFSREFYLACGMRNTELHPDLVDLEYAYRNFGKAKIEAVPRSFYHYRQHFRQMSRNRAGLEDFRKMSNVLQAFIDQIGIENVVANQVFYLQTFKYEKEDLKHIDIEAMSQNIFKSLQVQDIESAVLNEFLRMLSFRHPEMKNLR